MPKIHEFRLALAWFETNLSLLANRPPAGAPWDSLGRQHRYARVIEELARTGPAPHGKFGLPWTHPGRGRSFWYYELEGGLEGIDGNKVWNHVVPLRLRFLRDLSAPWLSGRCWIEGYAYPHGFGVVAHATIAPGESSPYDLSGLIDIAFKLRKDGKLWDDEGKSEARLEDIALRRLDDLRTLCAGPNAEKGVVRDGPFSVVTIIRGTDFDPAVPPAKDPLIRQRIHALGSWSPTWADDPLAEFDGHCLPVTGGTNPEQILHARRRGRVVWFQNAFKSDVGYKSLGCYHRNLVACVLHIEGLGRLAQRSADQLKTEPRSISPSQASVVRQAAGALGRAYGGKGTYKSWSPRTQIDQNDMVEAINAIRYQNQMPPLVAAKVEGDTKPKPETSAHAEPAAPVKP